MSDYLFIDTNIFLNLFHYSSDDLEELSKLTLLLDQDKLTLLLPEQITMEFRRNREAKIAESLKRIRELRVAPQFPQICKDYPEYKELRDHTKAFDDAHKRLIQNITKDVDAKSLRADNLISSLFEKGQLIPVTDAIKMRARDRYDLGNPPGKKGSLGDAVNWEALVETVDSGRDLYFITGDKDYCSDLDDAKFNGFLAEEWNSVKKSHIIFFKSLSSFFQQQFPQIKLVVESEKDKLIFDLAFSPNFNTTHSIVGKLGKYTDFTPAQVNAIVSAAVNNNQVYWIIEDDDIYQFLKTAVQGHEDAVEPETLRALQELLGNVEIQRVNSEAGSVE